MGAKVLVNFIQDRSGSMSSIWEETVNGFEQFLKSLKEGQDKDGIDYLFSLTCFDTQIETPIIAQPIDVNSFVSTFRLHGPRGGTALYDATGKTIKAVEDNRHGAEKIIVVICTDGFENSSREWSKEDLHASIDAKIKAGDWTFTYLGTQPETWADATAIGMYAGSTATYSGQSARATYSTVACAVNSLSSSPVSGSANMLQDFTTRSVRMAASMKTKQDDVDDKKTGIGAAIKPPVGRPRTPAVPPKGNTSRRWK